VSEPWLVPDWPAPARVRALSTFRWGGQSAGRYASLNLGDHVGDSTAAVAANRKHLMRAAALAAEPTWLRQVHGTAAANLDELPVSALPPAADAAYTRRAGPICAVLTADCVPILLAADAGDLVVAIHAGWRGLAAGIVAATLRGVRTRPQDLVAWIGPCIGREHYEVGAEVRNAICGQSAAADAAFRANEQGRYLADLPLLARQQLAAAGVSRIYGGSECTYGNPQRYFSHRRDGETGRQATLIWLDAEPSQPHGGMPRMMPGVNRPG
jgi:YfiH family protein